MGHVKYYHIKRLITFTRDNIKLLSLYIDNNISFNTCSDKVGKRCARGMDKGRATDLEELRP